MKHPLRVLLPALAALALASCQEEQATDSPAGSNPVSLSPRLLVASQDTATFHRAVWTRALLVAGSFSDSAWVPFDAGHYEFKGVPANTPYKLIFTGYLADSATVVWTAGDSGNSGSASRTIPLPVAIAPTPLFDIPSGSYATAQTLSISASGVDSVQISYDQLTWFRYLSSFVDSSSGRLYARSFKGGLIVSSSTLNIVVQPVKVDSSVGLAFAAPAFDTTLSYSSTSLSVRLKTTSAIHVDSVVLDGQKLTRGSDASAWTGTVSNLPVGATTLSATAYAGSRTGPATVRVVRLAQGVVDSSVALIFLAPSEDTSIANGTTSLGVVLKSISALRVDSVVLNGQKLIQGTGSDTARWSGTVSGLPEGTDTLRAVAYAGTKTSNRAILRVARLSPGTVDSTVSLGFAAPGADTSVANATTSVFVSLKTASVLHIDSVRVGSLKLAHGLDTTVWTGSVAGLAVGIDTLKAIAYAGTKTSKAAILRVTRANLVVDSTIAISFTGPSQDTTVGTGSLGVRVTTSSVLAIDSVVLGTQHLTRAASGGPWTGVVSIAAGSNTLRATVYAAGGRQSASASRNVIGLPAAPILGSVAGTYPDTLSLVLSDTTPGVTIYYTADGSTPTNSSSVYSSPVGLNANATVKAVAVAGPASSSVTSATYLIKHDTTLSALSVAGMSPAFSPTATSYSTTWAANLSSGSLTFATTDPKAAVTCQGPCSVVGNQVNFTLGDPGTTTTIPVKVANGSHSLTYNVDIARRPNAAAFLPVGGTYSRIQAVTLAPSSQAPIDSMQISTDGVSWIAYQEALFVTQSPTTIYARAFRNGLVSEIATATYTFNFAFPWNSSVTYGVLADARDGQLYRTVRLGGRNWMAENLNYKSANSVCYNGQQDCAAYGRLYLGSALDGVCPGGWTIPTATDWSNLFAVTSSFSSPIGIKSTAGWTGSASQGTDNYGMRILPGGMIDGSPDYMGTAADFWTSTLSANPDAPPGSIDVESIQGDVLSSQGSTSPSYSLSVRCVSP